jgi:hypothetical protein
MNKDFIAILPSYIFRVLHIGSMVGLSYKIIKDYLAGEITQEHATAFGVLGVTTMLAGNTSALYRICKHVSLKTSKNGRGS